MKRQNRAKTAQISSGRPRKVNHTKKAVSVQQRRFSRTLEGVSGKAEAEGAGKKNAEAGSRKNHAPAGMRFVIDRINHLEESYRMDYERHRNAITCLRINNTSYQRQIEELTNKIKELRKEIIELDAKIDVRTKNRNFFERLFK